MDSDRRQSFRAEPAKLVYARFGKANGGIVLNASEGGFCFQTVAPTEPNSVVELLVSPAINESIGVKGKIVWTDDEGKIGGLEFVDPPPEVKDRLMGLLLPQAASEVLDSEAIGDQLSPNRQSQSAMPTAISGPNRAEAPPATRPIFELPKNYKPGSTVPRMFGSLTGDAESSEIAPPKQSRKPRHWFFRGVANLILLSALLLLPAVYIYNFHPLLAYSLIDRAMNLYLRLGSSNGSAPAQTGASQNVPPPGDVSPVSTWPELKPEHAAESASTSNGESGTTSRETPAQDIVPIEKVASAQQTSTSRREFVKPTPNFPDRKQNIAKPQLPIDRNDPNELWFAVGQGDTNAEVALARLYLAGRLVNKNCEQGRILLTAAVKAGNSEAIPELRALLKSGCP